MSKFNLQRPYIHAQFTDSSSPDVFKTINPANGEVLAEVQVCTKDDIDRAIMSAQKGQKIWAAMT
ncbi:aldehyde dehydrogenase family protein, partial [Klebsiella pneumoniae]|uniref:aldehyde dehydrogenase family protein n=1 Tax=Klebsiella pneumoniae TaxID=573 RepID=UPI002245998E